MFILKAEKFYCNKATNLLPSNNTCKILKESKPFEFHRELLAYNCTPLESLNHLAKKFGVGKIFIKDESNRFGLHSFKALGASYAIDQVLSKNKTIHTFCTATEGNHGEAVAWATRLHNKNAVVYMSNHAAFNRIKTIESLGAKVVLVNKDYHATCKQAAIDAKKNNWQLVQDTALAKHESIPALIMAGYLTHFLELETTLHVLPKPNIDFVFLQVGVGSWAAAAIWYYINRYGKNRPIIILIEPDASDGMLASLRKGKRSKPNGNLNTVMAGLNCGMPSFCAWDIIKVGADFSMCIKDDYAKQAAKELSCPINDDPKIWAGNSGATGLAGFFALMKDDEYKVLKNELGINHTSRILFFNTEGI